MNTEHLRQSLKSLWLGYYRENRDWLVKLGVWVNCEGQRRPASSFILATLTLLEPDLLNLLPLIVDLSSNPDRIVIALGLNFNPDDALDDLEAAAPPVKYLPSSTPVDFPSAPAAADPVAVDRIPAEKRSASVLPAVSPSDKKDDSCEGIGPNPKLRYERTN